jgi:hypothetical protein
MSSESLETWAYQLGQPHPQTNTHPTVETKPTSTYADGRVDTGGGYERVRSYEYRPHTARQGKEDVYASIHRLCAVAWCFPDGATAADIDLRGKDVHHPPPGESHPDADDHHTGVEWLNVHDSPNLPDAGLSVMDHGRHSAVTQADKRAWAEDSKATLAAASQPDTCPDCGAEPETWATSPAVDGHECLRCVTEKTDDGAIEVGR